MNGNRNAIVTTSWSNPATAELYARHWPAEPGLRERCEQGHQCGGCSFFAPLNTDWGLCLNPAARHHLETVFEHFACPALVGEGWGPHSFSADHEFHCRCGGEPPAPTDDPLSED